MWRVPPLLAGVNCRKQTMLKVMWGKNIRTKQSRKRKRQGKKKDTYYELTLNKLKKLKKMSKSYRQIFS